MKLRCLKVWQTALRPPRHRQAAASPIVAGADAVNVAGDQGLPIDAHLAGRSQLDGARLACLIVGQGQVEGIGEDIQRTGQADLLPAAVQLPLDGQAWDPSGEHKTISFRKLAIQHLQLFAPRHKPGVADTVT
ncbi:hypothetical protein [Candidatus Vondammii sp. HM_W22]|uniref:hypothetical protein n=1 Tax=Candidatus Vondammii sp. HM_W22 TaxID=2687299 RepID=UPI001F1372FB|nr:hypothetical protein [Candidatus Vondammii sp. HM_W22]